MKRLMVGLLAALPLVAWAAEPAAQVAAAPVGGSVGGQLTQLVLGLLLVVGLIFGLAWLMRRVQSIGPGNAQVIEMIGSRALGPRDRLVLVQVGEEQILLGITPGRITPLHVLKTPVPTTQSQPATPEFAQRLMELLGKDQKDKK
ncbi:flagellar biosynthetic protein FliO [Pseudomonas sp. NFACC42-2]|uniref:flagellar biosynthetic protein FliO n=1 Tax=Pseudomonas sp. NFACC42-2 TaxID=1566193 RepID=UPI0008EC59D1|nr:flagellar biosynthetic protein FliO [Pseudomonas sp. NFACC42-2]SFS24945.1 flagellar protein FliO/FliZ [Pseudomonas sp. NFACC42-2]